MTTVIYNPEEGKMVSDGQASIGTTITSMNTKKVFKVNGCLVGVAGRLSSAMKFLAWIEQWMVANTVQYDFPEVAVQIPENMVEEDFVAIVADPTNKLFIFEGGNAFYEIENKPTAIGSGDVYALSALDAGCTAEEAIKIAIGRDCMSGGEIFSEEFDEHEEPLDREAAEKMSHEELVSYFFPVEIGEESCEEEDPGESNLKGAYSSLDKILKIINNLDLGTVVDYDDAESEIGPYIRFYDEVYVYPEDEELWDDNISTYIYKHQGFNNEIDLERLRIVADNLGIPNSQNKNLQTTKKLVKEFLDKICAAYHEQTN